MPVVGLGIAGQADGRSGVECVVTAPSTYGRSAAGGDAKQDVRRTEVDGFQVLFAELGMVFGPSTARVSAAGPPAMIPTT